MDAAFPYFSAKDDYSLLNMYKHTALKTYSPFLRNQDFVHPCSQGDMAENINSFITTTMPNASLTNSASIHGSGVAFHISHQGLKQESGIPSYHPPIAVFSDPCDINRFSFNTSDTTDKVEAEIIIPSDDSCIRGGFGKHCNNCTDANIWASSTSGQTSVAALTNFDIGKGKKRSFAQNKCLSIKSSTPKEGQTKRLCCSKKSNSGTKQKTAHSPANTKKIDTEPPKDFIHVRARRGQATDSHSLAERVRREKINERLRFLKDLVPGCTKTVGKTAMLEEIINYVHSLQRQVEFLSMKLAAVSPLYDFSIELNTSAKEQPHVEEGGEVLVRSFSNFEGTTHDSILKEASTASFGETA